MPWHSPLPTFVDSVAPPASDLNKLLDNANFLRTINRTEFVYNGLTNYTTTSSNYVDISSDFNRSLTTTGGPVLMLFCGVLKHSTLDTVIDLDFRVDGTRLGSGADLTGPGKGRHQPHWSAGFPDDHGMVIMAVLQLLSIASHTFEVEWRTPAGTATLLAKFQPRFFVYEL